MIDRTVAILILIVVFGPIAYSLFKKEREKKKAREIFFRMEEELKDKELAE